MFLEDLSNSFSQYDGLVQMGNLHQQASTRRAVEHSAAQQLEATGALKREQAETNDLLREQMAFQKQQVAQEASMRKEQAEAEKQQAEAEKRKQQQVVEFRKLMVMAVNMIDGLES